MVKALLALALAALPLEDGISAFSGGRADSPDGRWSVWAAGTDAEDMRAVARLNGPGVHERGLMSFERNVQVFWPAEGGRVVLVERTTHFASIHVFTLAADEAGPDATQPDIEQQLAKLQPKLAKIETGFATHRIPPADAFKQLDALRYVWRGGPVEERALRIQFRIAMDAHDLRGSLRTGATLLRYFKMGAEGGPMLAELQSWLSAALLPESGVALPEAAGLYWDYKELAPAGAEGDALALRLAGRLQAASLYGRAAELLQYQLTQRREDVAQGPLSVKVAALHILSGRPDRALAVLHETEQPGYTDQMRWDRKRVEAVALHQLGRDGAAMAALDDVPDAAAVRAEIHWRSKDWGAFVTESEAALPSPKGLGEPGQAAVLRQAVALAMLGREDKLQALRSRYGAIFKTLPSARAFDLLTRKVETIDPAALGEAMGAIPEASPAGAIGDLLDAGSS